MKLDGKTITYVAAACFWSWVLAGARDEIWAVLVWTATRTEFQVLVGAFVVLWLRGALDRHRTRSKQAANHCAQEQQRQEAKDGLARRKAEWDALPPQEKTRRLAVDAERQRKEAELRKLAAELAPYLDHEDRAPAGSSWSARDGDVGNGAGAAWSVRDDY